MLLALPRLSFICPFFFVNNFCLKRAFWLLPVREQSFDITRVFLFCSTRIIFLKPLTIGIFLHFARTVICVFIFVCLRIDVLKSAQPNRFELSWFSFCFDLSRSSCSACLTFVVMYSIQATNDNFVI